MEGGGGGAGTPWGADNRQDGISVGSLGEVTDDEASYQLAGAEPRPSNRTPGEQEETSAPRLAVSISLNLTCMWADSATQWCATLYNLRVSHHRRLQRSKEMNKTNKQDWVGKMFCVTLDRLWLRRAATNELNWQDNKKGV